MSEPRGNQIYFGNAEAFGGFDRFFSSTSSWPKLFAKFSRNCLAALVLPSVSGELICQVSGKTPSLLPLVTNCFQEYTSSLSLLSRLFWEKLPSCISTGSPQKDSKLELGIPQKKKTTKPWL